jgi:hypothetical protein
MNNLVVHLIAARVSLAKCEEEENFIENPELDATIEQSVSNIEFTLLQIVNRKEVFEKTSELIQILQDAGIDYTLLLYLQVSENVTKGKGFVAYLKGLCEQYKVPYKNQFFLDAVWAHFVRTGVQPITPTKYLVNRKKEDILQEYKTIRSRNDWGQHNAFFFQTFITVKGEGFRKLFFFITRTWQDGVVRMHEILSNGCFVHGTSMHEAHGAFEHAIEDEALTSLILDSEILASALQQPVSDTKRDILQFPSILSTEMVRRGLLNEEDVLQVVVKDKTRPRGGTVKVSFHFVLCICAEKGSHKQCIELCQSDYKEAITAGLVHLKAHGVLPQDRPLHSAWYAFDAKAAISNGFTTAFTLKDRSDPHSRKHSDQFICSGLTFKEELCGIPVQDLHGTHLTEHERLWLLQDQLYTTPKRYMLSYAAPFKADSKVNSYSIFIIYCNCPGIRTRNTPYGGRKKKGRLSRTQAPSGPFARSTVRTAIARRHHSTCQHGSYQH